MCALQMLAIPKILQGRNILVGAETGSGKTLSYLAPLLSLIKEEEETEGVVARLCHPRALIVAPSRVLARQILVSVYTREVRWVSADGRLPFSIVFTVSY